MGKCYKITIGNEVYDVIITKRYKQKNLVLRFKDNKFMVSAPYLTSEASIKEFVEKHKNSLFKRCQKNDPFSDKGIYIFGEFQPFNEGFYSLNGKYFLFKDKADFYETVNKECLDIFTKRVRMYEEIMHITNHYEVVLKKVKTYYGENDKKKNRIYIDLGMVHYSFEIIDSLIVHELAHHFIRNHSQLFYKVVLSYCPNYYKLDKKLKGTIFK